MDMIWLRAENIRLKQVVEQLHNDITFWRNEVELAHFEMEDLFHRIDKQRTYPDAPRQGSR